MGGEGSILGSGCGPVLGRSGKSAKVAIPPIADFSRPSNSAVF
jgi:hypothetical protein